MRKGPLAAMLLVLSGGRLAIAETPTSAERDVARAIAQSAAGYYDDGEWERAREHFHRAYDLIKAPTLALMEARALVKLGHLVEATEAYQRAMNIHGDETSIPFRKAATDARAENDALRRRIPSIRVILRSEESPVEVRIDGAPMSKDALRSAMPLDPGTHVISVSRAGSGDTWESVNVREGEERIIAIEPPRTPSRDEAAASSHSALRPLMWAAFATGGAGVALGVVTGALAVDRKAKLDELCNGQACPPLAEDTLRSYRNYNTVSTVGYVGGLVGLATGAIIFAVTPRGSRIQPRLGAMISSTETGLVVSGGF